MRWSTGCSNWQGTRMSTGARSISIGGVEVWVVRKAIKNLHLGVYPPHGRVRVAAPFAVSDDAVRLAVIGKLAWIRRHQAAFAAQPRQSDRELVSGESHYFLGRRYRLRVIEGQRAPTVVRRTCTIELHVRPRAGKRRREAVLQRWHRQELKGLIPALLEKWQAVLGVHGAAWGVKRMKTRWGSCNPQAHRIWLNLALVQKPVHCLEYIVVHELAHLIERRHNVRFAAILDRHLPRWKAYRRELNGAPLAHESWAY